MNLIGASIEDEVLPADLKEAYTLSFWRNYCLTQMNKCLNTRDFKGVRHWSLEHQRTVNDLEFLQFKKTDSERKMKIEKGN